MFSPTPGCECYEAEISVVIPVKNGSPYFRECLDGWLQQDFIHTWEVCIFDDGSTDDTSEVITEYKSAFATIGVPLKSARSNISGGVGFAKNGAVNLAAGRLLCFSDADDVSSPSRLTKQYNAAMKLWNSEIRMFIIGSMFRRVPENSTTRYARWANGLSDEELRLQIYTSNGPTLIAPTWLVSKVLYNRIGGFTDNVKTGFPEDLDFFYRSHRAGAEFKKVNSELVMYRFHPSCASLGVSENIIWDIRIKHIRENVLVNWPKFTIWSAGKQGKRFFKSLSNSEKEKVVAFCDVDAKKIRHGFYEEYDEKLRKVSHRRPVIPISDATPPLIVCVKLDMTGGELEALIAQSGWKEGTELVIFS